MLRRRAVIVNRAQSEAETSRIGGVMPHVDPQRCSDSATQGRAQAKHIYDGIDQFLGFIVKRKAIRDQ